MTDTPEAVRLADELDKWARNYASTTYEDDMAAKSAALLRRIPELEAELEAAKLGEAFHDKQANEYAQQVAHWIGKFDEVKAERDQLRAELEKVRLPDVDDLAQFIRWVSGNNKMGAGVLAERITEWLADPTPPRADQEGGACADQA